MLDFRPNLDNELIIAAAKFFWPLILKFKMKDAEVRLLPGGREIFDALKGKHVMVCPNHSHRHDPEVMFALSCLIGEEFNYIAAREVFSWNRGFNGWLLQRLGCYSVVRGAADRESVRNSKRLLSGGKKKLVLFPEGEISRQNDVLMPLESGAAQLSFMALDEIQKSRKGEPVIIVPMAIKYTYKHDLTEEMAELLDRLEERLQIASGNGDSLHLRLRIAAEGLLKALADSYGCLPKPGSDMNTRMKVLREHILKQIADFVQVELQPNLSQLDWVRILRNKVDDHIFSDCSKLSAYEKKLHDEKAMKLKNFYHDFDRVVRFMAIYDGYLAGPTTQERMIGVLELMENEIFGEVKIKGPRLVLIQVGKPINLLDHYAAYKQHRKPIVEQISAELSQQIASMLVDVDRRRKPVYVA